MIYSLFIAIIPSIQYFGQQLLFKHKYCRVVPIHSHLYCNLKCEVSRSDNEFKIVIIFWQCSREHSLFQAFYYIWTPGTGYREERNGFVKADDHLHFFQFMLGLHFARGLHFTLSLQSAFYTLSGILPLICSEQSAVCILHWLVFHLYSIYRYFSICYVIKTFFY